MIWDIGGNALVAAAVCGLALLGVAFIFGKDAWVGWGFILAALVLALWVVLN